VPRELSSALTIERQILDRLKRLERDEDVRILYACESGSRAWGFESSDSDFDVRFIYIHPREWYLSVDTDSKRDVIELPIDGELDISGWELRKALRLFRKSNPPLLEWLGSPIVYIETTALASRLRKLQDTYCSPKACAHHYLHMARGNFREYLRGPEVRLKKYLYVLRPVFAIKWIEAGLGVVPTEFPVLVDRLAEPPLQEAIGEFLAQKRRGFESDLGPAIPAISDFIQMELERLGTFEMAVPVSKAPIEPLNELFRSTLEQAWS
jgi:predicted nucleotidyltransferase